MYAAASAVGVERRIDWIDPSKPSVQRYSLLDDALPAHVWSRARNVWGVDLVYSKAVEKVMPRVRDAATAWAVKMLDDQALQVGHLVFVVDQGRQALHAAAQKAQTEAKTVWKSGSGMTAAEAHAVLDAGPKTRSTVFERLKRAGYMRTVRTGGNKDLLKLMAHPQGVEIVDSFAESAEEGYEFSSELLEECVEAIQELRGDLRSDESLVWRFPPAISAGVATIGRPHPAALTGFSLLWARVEGSRTEGALEVASNALLALQLVGGPLGAALGEVLDFVLSAITASVAFVRAVEQDQAGTASTFATDAEKLSEGASTLGAVLVGVAALGAAVALPGAVSQVTQRVGRGTKKLVVVAEQLPPPRNMPDPRGLSERGIKNEEARGISARMTGDARMTTTHTGALETAAPGERVFMGPVPEPNPVDLTTSPRDLLRGTDVGTEGRTGMQFHEFTTAGVSHRLRVDFDPQTKLPRSVEYVLSRESTVGSALPDRPKRFPLDRGIEPEFQLRHQDYAVNAGTPPPVPQAFRLKVSGPNGEPLLRTTIPNVAQPGAATGLERGHLVPRQAATSYPEALADIDVISNIAPMAGRGPLGVNQGSWAFFEGVARDLAQRHGSVTVRIELVF